MIFEKFETLQMQIFFQHVEYVIHVWEELWILWRILDLKVQILTKDMWNNYWYTVCLVFFTPLLGNKGQKHNG